MSKNYNRMSVAQLTAEYETALKEELIKAIENVDNTVKQMVSECVAAVIGVKLGLKRTSYGLWEMSRYETNGEFVKLVTDAANAYIKDNAEPLTKTFLSKLSKEDTSELKDLYKSKLYDAVEDMMEEKAQEDSEAIFTRLTGKKLEVES